MFFQGSGVHTNTDGAIVIFGGLYHLFDTLCAADIAGIDPQTSGTRFGGFDGAFVVEMNVGDDWHAHLWNDLRQCD